MHMNLQMELLNCTHYRYMVNKPSAYKVSLVLHLHCFICRYIRIVTLRLFQANKCRTNYARKQMKADSGQINSFQCFSRKPKLK
ncbi:hypothetical protein ACSQ67_007515 [Phaseolus vulgaris]